MNRRSLLTTTTTFLWEALTKTFCCRRDAPLLSSVLLLPPAICSRRCPTLSLIGDPYPCNAH